MRSLWKCMELLHCNLSCFHYLTLFRFVIRIKHLHWTAVSLRKRVWIEWILPPAVHPSPLFNPRATLVPTFRLVRRGLDIDVSLGLQLHLGCNFLKLGFASLRHPFEGRMTTRDPSMTSTQITMNISHLIYNYLNRNATNADFISTIWFNITTKKYIKYNIIQITIKP